jgi:hypothetical protein
MNSDNTGFISRNTHIKNFVGCQESHLRGPDPSGLVHDFVSQHLLDAPQKCGLMMLPLQQPERTHTVTKLPSLDPKRIL